MSNTVVNTDKIAKSCWNCTKQPGQRYIFDSYIVAIPFGIFGSHHFYLGRPLFGVFYLLTFGNFLLGFITDLCRMPALVEQYNNKERDHKKISLIDVYILCIPMGFFGLHHFYLGRKQWGFVYLCTFGLLGLGVFFDLCRIPQLVSRQNANTNERDFTECQTDLLCCHIREESGTPNEPEDAENTENKI